MCVMKWLFVLAFTVVVAFSQTNPPAASDSWWKQAVIYEVYPRSFGDTNGDGIGDLNGITQHLDYLQDLRIDAIWITPFFPSPQVDFGYDISDYTAIDPQYGTMADFDKLVAEAQKRGIRIIADMVLNHTSDQHKWFIESKSSRTNPKADWFIWRDGKANGEPPNNWQSIFGHSAWQFEPARKQYYYHAFYKQQPDLNWRNEQVRNAMYDAVRFWMKKGVAGFRLDAITSMYEDTALRDEPKKGGTDAYGEAVLTREFTDNLPEVHDTLRELRKVINEYPGRVLIGETYLPNVQELAKMYGANNDELHLPMDTQLGFLNKLSAPLFRAKLQDAETQLNGNPPLFVFDNHDNKRSWDRYGDGVHNVEIAKLIATALLTPRATALVYYGQELGLATDDPKRKEDVQDPIGRIGWPKEKGRDGERKPMPWNGDTNAGFTTSHNPWLPLTRGFEKLNVSAEQKDPNSILNYYKTLLRLRKQNAALRDGAFLLVQADDPNVLSYMRKTTGGKAVLVTMNFTATPKTMTYPDAGGHHGLTLVSSFAKAGDAADLNKLTLPAFGSWVGEVQP
jgi:alpha-glucosidase